MYSNGEEAGTSLQGGGSPSVVKSECNDNDVIKNNKIMVNYQLGAAAKPRAS